MMILTDANSVLASTIIVHKYLMGIFGLFSDCPDNLTQF